MPNQGARAVPEHPHPNRRPGRCFMPRRHVSDCRHIGACRYVGIVVAAARAPCGRRALRSAHRPRSTNTRPRTPRNSPLLGRGFSRRGRWRVGAEGQAASFRGSCGLCVRTAGSLVGVHDQRTLAAVRGERRRMPLQLDVPKSPLRRWLELFAISRVESGGSEIVKNGWFWCAR